MFLLDGSQDVYGKWKYRQKIVSSKVHHMEMDFNGNWYPVESEECSPSCKSVAYRHYYIPCGKCIGCRLDYSRQWANRLMLEYKYHDPDKCWFVTLTYNDASVPIHNFINPETGEKGYSLSLEKRDIQLFNKRLRKAFPDSKIRMFVAGEYGELTHRPHAHGIYYDLPIDNEKLVKWTVTNQGFTLYKCPELEKIWRNGNVIVSAVSWQTCAYTARYVTKKLNGDMAKFYEVFNIEPEFSLMSRKPGIARQWIDDHPEAKEKGIHVSAGDRAINCELPRYFKSVLDLQDQIECAMMNLQSLDIEIRKYEASLEQDKNIIEIQKQYSFAADDYTRYLQVLEQSQKARGEILKRGDI